MFSPGASFRLFNKPKKKSINPLAVALLEPAAAMMLPAAVDTKLEVNVPPLGTGGATWGHFLNFMSKPQQRKSVEET